jgi:pimeloyl-ACP methyl ester carboxylesterase
MTAALLAPERIARLVVVDIAPRRYHARQAGVVAALVAVDLAALGSRADADAVLASRVPDAALRAFLLTNLVRDGAGFRWRCNLPAIVAALGTIEDFPHLGRIYGGATAFIHGGASDYLDPVADRETITRLFPAARFVTLAGAGHWVHADRPREFQALLGELLADAA